MKSIGYIKAEPLEAVLVREEILTGLCFFISFCDIMLTESIKGREKRWFCEAEW